MSDDYPARPSHFAHKFVRLLAKCSEAQIIGADACWLLAVIVHTEDRFFYRRAVTFWNSQLMDACGIATTDRLIRIRKAAIDGGWLHYQPGKRGVAGVYWVKIPPQFQDLPDGSVGEDPVEFQPEPETQNEKVNGHSVRKTRQKPRRKPDRNHDTNPTETTTETTNPSSLSLDPSPSPIPKEEDPPNPPGRGEGSQDFPQTLNDVSFTLGIAGMHSLSDQDAKADALPFFLEFQADHQAWEHLDQFGDPIANGTGKSYYGLKVAIQQQGIDRRKGFSLSWLFQKTDGSWNIFEISPDLMTLER